MFLFLPAGLACLQVARLQREMEGLEEQRARAREEAKRAEQARQQLEQEIKVGAGPRSNAKAMHEQHTQPVGFSVQYRLYWYVVL